jgi:hypothetical protein
MKNYRVSSGVLLIQSPRLYAGAQEKAPTAPDRGYAQQELLITLQQQETE